LQPLTPHTPQLYNGYIYAVAHVHDVDCLDIIQDGKTSVDIDAGFEVAPGDACDIDVASAHPWGTYELVFSDGAVAPTALSMAKHGYKQGASCSFLIWISATKSQMQTGWKGGRNGLQRDGARVAASKHDHNDVLLRKRA
jgi:hypothetical protein